MNDNKGFACFGLAILAALAIVVDAIARGWVLSVLWGWFVSPLFGLPGLKVAPAIGFTLVVAMLTHQSQKTEEGKKDGVDIAVGVIGELVSPFITLLFGWIIYQFI